ncbi:MAG: hypothetical protein RLZZ592_2963 [Pseudomonadota bacterium]|jgi:disulfide bond formation protein DsbB|nr:protein dithiol:quinone oxidoreductase [Pseudomonadota bacterium]
MSLIALPARQPRATLALIALACLASVGAALFAQHRLDMQPCPWCILQRILFLLIGTVAALAAVLPDGLGAALSRRLSGALIALLALAGTAAALYQHFVAAKLPSCDLTLADRIISSLGLDAALPDVFEVRASCAEAAVSVLGVPFELWSAMLFVLLAGLGLRLAIRVAERRRFS